MGQAQPKMVGPNSTHKIISLWGGPNPAHTYGLGRIRSDPPSHVYYFCRNVNSYCSRSTCNQTVAEAIDGRSEVGGNLAEEKELLSLAWSGAGGATGGRNGGGVGCLWRRKKEEENLQREREDLAVAAP